MVPAARLRVNGIASSERHIAVLFRGRDEFYAQVGPLMVDGLDEGDSEVHLVEEGESHLERLRSMGVQADHLLESGQLTVIPWSASTLAGGTFSRVAMAGYVRRGLDARSSTGTGRTVWVGNMGWAAKDMPGVDELIPFEDQLNEVLRGRRDVIVCAYDLELHDSLVIAGVMATHPLVIVRGKLQPMHTDAPVAPRDRVLAAAHDQFHKFGVRATGVDSVIEAAGVAKSTFYRHFPSKDELLLAWLRDRRPRWFFPIRDRLNDSGLRANEKIALLFRLVADWLEYEGFRGCAFQNTAVEFPDSTHPAHMIIRDYLDEIDDYLRDILVAGGFAEARELSAQIGVLLSGALSASAARQSLDPVQAAGQAAEQLLEYAPRN
jgi:AcrR family transcriptional regulator